MAKNMVHSHAHNNDVGDDDEAATKWKIIMNLANMAKAIALYYWKWFYLVKTVFYRFASFLKPDFVYECSAHTWKHTHMPLSHSLERKRENRERSIVCIRKGYKC